MGNFSFKRIATKLLSLGVAVLLGAPLAHAQGNVAVNGTVTDASGEPMVGVSVVEKGTTNGIITDIDGKYTLTVKSGSVLVFSSIGYVTQEVPAKNGVVNVKLDEDKELLEEVVVIGYGTTKSKNFTGSVDMVKMSDSPAADLHLSSATDLLRGRLSGVIMGAESGSVGSSSSIRIRGQKSINSTSEYPLIILNGVIFPGQLDDIDPDTIESISVLKDATSLAAYGSKAAQGVIMVTTKKGGQAYRKLLDFPSALGSYLQAEIS